MHRGCYLQRHLTGGSGSGGRLRCRPIGRQVHPQATQSAIAMVIGKSSCTMYGLEVV
jgi:hypothetical protein